MLLSAGRRFFSWRALNGRRIPAQGQREAGSRARRPGLVSQPFFSSPPNCAPSGDLGGEVGRGGPCGCIQPLRSLLIVFRGHFATGDPVLASNWQRGSAVGGPVPSPGEFFTASRPLRGEMKLINVPHLSRWTQGYCDGAWGAAFSPVEAAIEPRGIGCF